MVSLKETISQVENREILERKKQTIKDDLINKVREGAHPVRELLEDKRKINLINSSLQTINLNCEHPFLYLLSNSCFNFLEIYCPCCGKKDIVSRQAIDEEFCSLTKVIDLRRKPEESDYKADRVISEVTEFLKGYQQENPEADYMEIKSAISGEQKELKRIKKEG